MATETATSPAQKRIVEVDWVRAVAIALMVHTHVAMIFYDFTNPVSNWFSDLGGTICFTLFLFAAGASLAILAGKQPVSEVNWGLLKRSATFYLLFVGLATLATSLTLLPSTLALINVPDLTDFILAFSYFFLFSTVLIRVLKILNLRTVLILSALMYVVGLMLYPAAVPEGLAPYKALLVGHADFHRFPLLQYMFIYVLGFAYIHYYKYLNGRKLSLLFVAALGGHLILNQLFGFYRWSASPGFVSYGLVWIAGLLLFFYLAKTFVEKYIASVLNAISKSSSSVLVVHLVALLAIMKFSPSRTSGLAVLAITTLLIYLGWLLRRWIKL